MALDLNDNGEVLGLKAFLGVTAPGSKVYHLYSNNYTPTDSDLIGSFTEVSSSLYAPITLTNSLWTVTTSSGTTTAVYPNISYSFGAATTVYGYYITDTASGTTVWWAERYSTPPLLYAGSGNLTVSPAITLD